MRFRRVLSLVGMVIMFMGLAMFFSVAVALIYQDGSALAITFSAIVSIAFGLILFLQDQSFRGGDLSLKDGFGIVGFSWIGASLAGSLPFFFSGSIPIFAMAFFESASGLTTTGSTIISDIEALPFISNHKNGPFAGNIDTDANSTVVIGRFINAFLNGPS